MFISETVSHGLAVVVQKTLRNIRTADDPPLKDWQIRCRIVPAVTFEMGEHIRSPVRIARLETVFCEAAQRGSCQRTRILDKHLANLIEHDINSRTIEIIVLKTALAMHRDVKLRAGHPMPGPQNRPLPFGHFPVQRSVRLQSRCQVSNILNSEWLIIR